ATANVAARMGAGHRTIDAPIRRHRRAVTFRLGSNSPKRLPTTSAAGISVRATATATTMPTAHGTPKVWKGGSRVKLRLKTAPAIVKPEAKTTFATPL